MAKYYTHHATQNQPSLEIMKWLRANGVRDVDFKIHRLTYSMIVVEFLNDKLELKYTLQYDWANT